MLWSRRQRLALYACWTGVAAVLRSGQIATRRLPAMPNASNRPTTVDLAQLRHDACEAASALRSIGVLLLLLVSAWSLAANRRIECRHPIDAGPCSLLSLVRAC